MRINLSIALACLTTLWIVNASECIAQEVSRQSPAAKQGAKARAYANRNDENNPTDADRATGEDGKAPEGDRPLGVDAATLDKTQKDIGETFKNLEKGLDLFK